MVTPEVHETRVHVFEEWETDELAYARTQCDDDINDGDILVLPTAHVVGFMCKAWPIAVTPETDSFHETLPGFYERAENQVYITSRDQARKLAGEFGWLVQREGSWD